MKIIKVNLPKEQDEIIICPFFDLHIGEPACDVKAIENDIKFVQETPNAYAVLGGDIVDNTTKNSIGDVYRAKLTPQQQLEQACAYFAPIKDKIICIVSGNHEERTWRESGIDLMGCMAMQLGIENKYANEGAVLFIKFGHNRVQTNKQKGYYQNQYTIYVTHGAGGARKVGGKANRLYDTGDVVDCDCVIIGHTHEPLCFKKIFYRTDLTKQSVTEKERLYVNTGSYLKYAGYAERKGYLPSARVMPKIYLSGKWKKGCKDVVAQVIM